MTRKVDGTQRSGRFTAPSAAGGFGGADTALTRLARPFTPKPFRSTGGMSASADTMMSIGMGRHNIDEELPQDQVNIAAIVDKKVSDRRYLPRKKNNMQKYLHTTPVSEAISLNPSEIVNRYERFERDIGTVKRSRVHENVVGDALGAAAGAIGAGSDFLKRNFGSSEEGSVGGISPAAYSTLSVVAPFVPVLGDVFYGYSAYYGVKDIMDQAKKLEEFLASINIDVDLTANPDDNKQVLSKISIARASDRAYLKEAILKIGIRCFETLTQAIAALPLDLVPALKPIDFISDVGLTGSAFLAPSIDPEGEKISNALIDFAQQYGDFARSVGSLIPGLVESVNFMGNLGEIRQSIATDEVEVTKSATDPDVLAELRRRKKRRANEMSTTAGIAGYTGPMQGPRDPKQFYSTMAKAAGSEYLVDPVKNSKPKP